MKTIKYLGLSVLTTLAITSCDDSLDFYPEISTHEANTMNQLEYYAFEVNNWYGWLPKLMDNGNLQGLATRDEDSDFGVKLSGDISASKMTQPQTNKRYNDYYSHLRSINYLEFYAKKYYEGDQKDLDGFRAQAHFFRAYESWIFFRDFGPGTIVREVLDTSSDEVMAPRATRDEFVDFMIEDLQAAINSGLLPKESAIRNSAEEGRITIGAAYALLGRICLFEGTWQKYHTEMDEYPAANNPTTAGSRAERSKYLLAIAKDALEKVIADSSYELFHNDALGQASYKYMFILENNAMRNPAGVKKSANHEYILTNRFDENAKIASQNWVHTYTNMGIGRHLVESFGTRDGSPKSTDYSDPRYWCGENTDPRIAEVGVPFMSYKWTYSSKRDNYTEIGSPTVHSSPITFMAAVNKWSVETACGANDASYDIPVIRLGGVYLDYAEVLCELNGGNTLTVGENEHINLLRKRAHMPTKNQWTLDEIRNERSCELYLEGYRVDDVRRWAKGDELFGDNLEGLYIGKSASERKNIFVASPCYTVQVKSLTWDILNNYKWTLLENGDKWLYVFCDPNNKPTYAQASSRKGPDGKTFFVGADPTKTINDGAPISSEGYYILEPKESRKFQLRTYLVPIPLDQMELNPNLAQNPFWN